MYQIDLSNKKILITGASSGIGRSAAEQLSKCGATLVLCGRNHAELEKTREMLDNPEIHTCYSFDLMDYDQYEEVFRSSVSDGKKLNGIVHCAGIAEPTPFRNMKFDTVGKVIETNLISFFHLISLYIKRKYSEGGSIVAVSSINTHLPQKCMNAYAASKGAIEALVKTAAIELNDKKIRINGIVPGVTATPMTDKVDKSYIEQCLKMQLLGMVQPSDVANAIVFLISDMSQSMTGRLIYVDGGYLGGV